LTSWRNAKINRDWRSLYQLHDNDLPEKSGSKFLFTANRYSPQTTVKIDASIEMSVFRLVEGEDFSKSVRENILREGRKIQDEGNWLIGDVHFSYVDEAIRAKDSTGKFRFVFRHFKEDLWLYAKIAGYSKECFAESLKIFAGVMTKT
jgi:hypothetical protein